MTTQYGAPLTGAQMKLLRAAGLPDGTEFEVFVDRWGFCSAGKTPVGDIHDYAPCRLPADHIAYTLLVAGWLDGRNVALWFGGEEAPDDWLEGSEVLWDNRGQGTKTHGVKDPSHPWSHGNAEWYDIIAYIRKAEGKTTHADRVLADAERMAKRMGGKFVKNELWGDVVAASGEAAKAGACAGGFEVQPETVTIAKMTEAEAKDWCKRFDPYHRYEIYDALKALGLIKPEPTRLERFWSSQPNGGAHVADGIIAWVRDALNFERD